MKGMRSEFGGRSGEGGSRATNGDVQGGEIGRDCTGTSGGDDSRLGLLKKPLDGLAVGLVTQFTSQLENPSSTGGGHTDAAATTVDLGVAIFCASLEGVGSCRRVGGGGGGGVGSSGGDDE